MRIAEGISKPERYRRYAAEMRAIAAGMDRDQKNKLNKMADDFEQLAGLIARLEDRWHRLDEERRQHF